MLRQIALSAMAVLLLGCGIGEAAEPPHPMIGEWAGSVGAHSFTANVTGVSVTRVGVSDVGRFTGTGTYRALPSGSPVIVSLGGAVEDADVYFIFRFPEGDVTFSADLIDANTIRGVFFNLTPGELPIATFTRMP